jgi:hypothetical protein
MTASVGAEVWAYVESPDAPFLSVIACLPLFVVTLKA